MSIMFPLLAAEALIIRRGVSAVVVLQLVHHTEYQTITRIPSLCTSCQLPAQVFQLSTNPNAAA